jgi:UDP-N-acetyl-alpha-D-muramoyl-L-alanyl-L-glutamate epimerase
VTSRRSAKAEAAQDGPPFRYEGFALDRNATRLRCHYQLGRHRFQEVFELDPPDKASAVGARPAEARDPARPGRGHSDALHAAAQLVHLLAGVSYYKTSAPPVVDLGSLTVGPATRALLLRFYREGLAEFAYRNGLDLSHLELRPPTGRDPGPSRGPGARSARPHGSPPRTLIPFGGGMDSIVTAEELAGRAPGSALFVVAAGGHRFPAIESPATLAGLPIVRASRWLDAKVLRSSEHGFLNGHVPVTGIISALAVMAAVRWDYEAVAMSNEWSASFGTLLGDGRVVNHQYSKSFDFEVQFRRALDEVLEGRPTYFSYLRSSSELDVARRFSSLSRYHPAFHSCNRAFRVDPAERLERWCGTCDKCCFIDLVLSPFMERRELAQIFDGCEPLENSSVLAQLQALTGLGTAPKPFECVGDVDECRVALLLAASRPDRAASAQLQSLAVAAGRLPTRTADELLAPMGADFIPDVLAADHLVV